MMKKCLITKENTDTQYLRRLTTGEYIKSDIHHAIMLEVKNYFFDKKTALEQWKTISEHDKLKKTLVAVEQNYTSKYKLSLRREHEKTMATMEERAGKDFAQTLKGLTLKNSLSLLQRAIEDYKTLLGSDYDDSPRLISKQSRYLAYSREFCPNIYSITV